MHEPLVSVIVPCFNHESFVEQCLRSILDQDYRNIELIVIDDGSTDSSVVKIEALRTVCASRFTRAVFIYRENRGLCNTLNEALGCATGQFIAPFASDDIMMPNRISTQVRAFFRVHAREPRLVAVYSGVELVNAEGKLLRTKKGSGRVVSFESAFLRKEFLPTPTFFALKVAIADVGNFDSSLSLEDFYMRLKLTAAGGKFYVIKEPLVQYRQHAENMSKKSDSIWLAVSAILEQYRQHPLFPKALARSMLIQANDFLLVSRDLGRKWAARAVREDPTLLTSFAFAKFFIKAFLLKHSH